MSSLVSLVNQFYTRYPYPAYPLFAPLRWQEGMTVSAIFSEFLMRQARRSVSQNQGRELILGCGDTLPYIYKKWLPKGIDLDCLDLAKTNLIRAQWRLWPRTGSTRFIHNDIDQYLSRLDQGSYHHIDCYGVLHHLPNPSETLSLIEKALLEGGTLRIMVYNHPARRFIHQIQKALRLLKLDPMKKQDLREAQRLLTRLALDPVIPHPGLKRALSLIRNSHRFADAFMHPREFVGDLAFWGRALEAAGLEPVALLDRFGELDHLENPLVKFPSFETLDQLALKGHFKQNLEIYVQKPGPRKVTKGRSLPLRAAFKRPPLWWFEFGETDDLSLVQRFQIWQKALWQWQLHYPMAYEPKVSLAAKRRLARIGALWASGRVLTEPLCDPPVMGGDVGVGPDEGVLERVLGEVPSFGGVGAATRKLVVQRFRKSYLLC